jgi:hypothetical protein
MIKQREHEGMRANTPSPGCLQVNDLIVVDEMTGAFLGPAPFICCVDSGHMVALCSLPCLLVAKQSNLLPASTRSPRNRAGALARHCHLMLLVRFCLGVGSGSFERVRMPVRGQAQFFLHGPLARWAMDLAFLSLLAHICQAPKWASFQNSEVHLPAMSQSD